VLAILDLGLGAAVAVDGDTASLEEIPSWGPRQPAASRRWLNGTGFVSPCELET